MASAGVKGMFVLIHTFLFWNVLMFLKILYSGCNPRLEPPKYESRKLILALSVSHVLVRKGEHTRVGKITVEVVPSIQSWSKVGLSCHLD